MDFFPEPPDPAQPVPQRRPPVWSGPPDDVMPGVVPVELVLGRSDEAAVLLQRIRAFPTGLQIDLCIRFRQLEHREDLHREFFSLPGTPHPRDVAWQAGRFKWGFQFADGRMATNLDEGFDAPAERGNGHDAEPDHPVLTVNSGQQSERSLDLDYWLWPLPPAGVLRVVCQWVGQGIDQTVHDLDAQPFLAAAARSRRLWADT